MNRLFQNQKGKLVEIFKSEGSDNNVGTTEDFAAAIAGISAEIVRMSTRLVKLELAANEEATE